MLDYMRNENSNKYSENCSNPIHITYKKRIAKDGTEYLVKNEEINIEEMLEENYQEIKAMEDLLEQQEIVKQKELLDEMTNEEFLNELEQNKKAIDCNDFAEVQNAMLDLNLIFNKFPIDIRKKYKTAINFAHEYVPSFLKETREKIMKEQEIKNRLIQQKQTKEITEKKTAELQAQIEALQEKLKGAENV